jgi:hypothetical protein
MFGWTLYILFGLAVMVGTINRLVVYLLNRSQHEDELSRYMLEADGPKSRGGAERFILASRARTWFRKHITTPALFGNRHAKPFGFVLLPTRLQSVFVGVLSLRRPV